MGFHLENRKNSEIKERPDDLVSRERLSEAAEVSENFDDCALEKASDRSGKEVDSKTPEQSEEDFEDCGSRLESPEAPHPELADGEDDDFSDCGKDAGSGRAVEVTYITDGEISQETSREELQAAYSECGDPENMSQPKENINENEHTEVLEAEVVERPDSPAPLSEAAYENTQQNFEDAQEHLEEQQEAAETYPEEPESLSGQAEGADVSGAIDETQTDELPAKFVSETNEHTEEPPDADVDTAEGADSLDDEPEKDPDVPAETRTESLASEEVNDRNGEETAVSDHPDAGQPAAENAEAIEMDSEAAFSDETGAQRTDDLKEQLEQGSIQDAPTGSRSEEIHEAPANAQAEPEYRERAKDAAEPPRGEDLDAAEGRPLQSLDAQADPACEKDALTSEEAGDLAAENMAALDRIRAEQRSTAEAANLKFQELMAMERGTDDYRQALQAHNELIAKGDALHDEADALSARQEQLEQRKLELREAQLARGKSSAALAEVSINRANALEAQMNEEYYRSKPSSGALASLRESNSDTIYQLQEDTSALKLAMDAKMSQLSDYVLQHNLGRYETSRDPYYRQLSEEYLSLKAVYDKARYSIVKLDESNILISDTLGDDYTPVREQSPRSAIREVVQGRDEPSETNYFIDETRAAEVLSSFRQETWEGLTLSEQKKALERLADYNAEILGIEDKPNISYYRNEDPSDFGKFTESLNVIEINLCNLEDAAEAADTISHEYRHKYQHDRAARLENERDLAFREGLSRENYIPPEQDRVGYRNQLVEADASAYAGAVRSKLAALTAAAAAPDAADARLFRSAAAAEVSETRDPSAPKPPRLSVEVPQENRAAAEIDPRRTLLTREFLTNGGERITYAQAIDRITARAAEYMEQKGGVAPEIREQALADMRQELIAQSLEAESRGLGDHGIRHIYGNFERGESYLRSRTDLAGDPRAELAEQKLAILIAQVYHDEGYRLSPNNFGTQRAGPNGEKYSDLEHDRSSLRFWNAPARQALYENVLSPEVRHSVETAIGTHNSRDAQQIEANTALDSDLIVSTVHICDKLALSQREKLPELLAGTPRLAELAEGVNSAWGTLRHLGLYENGALTEQGARLLELYQNELCSYIDRCGYEPDYAARLKSAVQKDVGFDAGRFSSKMNYIYTPPDCFRYNAATGRNEITVYTISRPDGTAPELAGKQAEKLLEDLGLPETLCREAVAAGGYDFGAQRGISVRIKPVTESQIHAAEVAHGWENRDLEALNRRIELGRQKFEALNTKLSELAGHWKRGAVPSYNRFINLVLGFDYSGALCTEAEYDRMSTSEKVQIIQNAVVSGTLLESVRDTLYRKERTE